MATTSIAPHPLFPSVSERSYHYRKTVAVRPSSSHYTSHSASSYSSFAFRESSHSGRPISTSGIFSFSAMGLFKDKDHIRERKISTSEQPSEPVNRLTKRPSMQGLMKSTLMKVKPKRSLASLLTMGDGLPTSFHEPPSSEPAASTTSSAPESKDGANRGIEEIEGEEEVVGEPVERFQPRDRFRTKQGMTLHPYPQEAPYMQAYDPVLLDNDRYAEDLLRRLTLNTPSFRDYSKKAPLNVLDLGCGEGRWVLETAATWGVHGTTVTGFDLMDVLCDAWEDAPHNARFVRGNFVKYHLPFSSNSFDFVRMANLTLCIPYHRWEFVLREVKRVLMPNGRLELIDDHIFFPYEKAPSRPTGSPYIPPACQRLPPISCFDTSDDEDGGSDTPDDDIDSSTTTLVDSDLESFLPQDKLRLRLQKPCLLPDPYIEWEKQQASSQCMETFFERMLEQHHGIHPRPAEFIRELVAQVFGKPSVNKVATMHLYLAPLGECSEGEREEDGASTKSVHSSSSSSLSKKAWMSIDWDWKDKKEPRPSGEMSGYSSPVPTFVSLKAASRLGIDVSPLNTPETMGVKSGSRLGMTTRLFIPRNQTPGLIFWPSTFLPMSPSELEMHVCRHMHVLLGCKASLAEFIAKFGDERGERFVGDKEFEDMIWDYECFRRQRFHWPSDIPDVNLDDLSTDPISKPASRVSAGSDPSLTTRTRSGSIPPSFGPVKYRRDELTHVRTIRVFEAFKTLNDS